MHPEQPSLTAISNTAVELHRESFGRGPGAAKSYVTDDLVTCVLSDVFTASERTLIGVGEADLVRTSRTVHQVAVEETYKTRMSAAVGRPVTAHLSTINVEADIAIDIFVLGPS